MQIGQIAGESSTISKCVIVIHTETSVEIPPIIRPHDRNPAALDQVGSRWMVNAKNARMLNINTKNKPKSRFENGIVFID